MMENLPWLVRVGGALRTPFHYIYHHVHSGVCSSWEVTPAISTPPLYVLCGKNNKGKGETGGPFLI